MRLWRLLKPHTADPSKPAPSARIVISVRPSFVTGLPPMDLDDVAASLPPTHLEQLSRPPTFIGRLKWS